MTAAVPAERRRAMLRSALGFPIIRALHDADVAEIMVNPDGRLWIDYLSRGCIDTQVRIDPAQTERIIRLVASDMWQEAHRDAPLVSAELTLAEDSQATERFEGILPPVATAPCFAIRKSARRIFSLEDYESVGIIDAAQGRILRDAIGARRNILVAGATSSGKTTLANALLAEMAGFDQRIVLIEDTRELQCPAQDVIALKTRPGRVSMTDLVRSTLRLRPDRIVVGEIRGGEALDLLKAWSTGHPGGIATVHANGALAALYRLEALVQEAVPIVPRKLIADAVDLILFLAGRGPERRLTEIVEVRGCEPDGRYDTRALSSHAAEGTC
jgi:type IV secretion system protein TrbB